LLDLPIIVIWGYKKDREYLGFTIITLIVEVWLGVEKWGFIGGGVAIPLSIGINLAASKWRGYISMGTKDGLRFL